MDKKNTISTIAAGVSAVSVATGLVRDLKSKYDERVLFTASVPETSYVYPEIMKWLNSETRTKRIKFISTYRELSRHYDSRGVSRVTVEGHTLEVTIETPDINKGSTYDAEYGENMFASNVVFTAKSSAAIDALERKLEDLANRRRIEAKTISLYSLSSFGWEEQNPSPRSIDSVFLPDGMKEEVMEDFERFLASEKRFETIGLPWHRGYLFYGPPGNGKSSMAAALASHYKMNLYNMPLSAVKSDSSLAECIGRIQKNSILLLEDIDIFSKTMKREQADTGPTLAGLLNALDGVSTPHGLVTIMTTNHAESLDEALVRPGRIDKKLELTRPDLNQIKNMFKYVYGESLMVTPKEFNSMAELAEVFKRNCFDAEAARLSIKREN